MIAPFLVGQLPRLGTASSYNVIILNQYKFVNISKEISSWPAIAVIGIIECIFPQIRWCLIVFAHQNVSVGARKWAPECELRGVTLEHQNVSIRAPGLLSTDGMKV